MLIARIYEAFPLECPLCGGNMRLIVFITEGVQMASGSSLRRRQRAGFAGGCAWSEVRDLGSGGWISCPGTARRGKGIAAETARAALDERVSSLRGSQTRYIPTPVCAT